MAGWHEDFEDETYCPERDEPLEPEDFEDDDEADYERDMDFLLAQQELEDFEQADEYFGSYDGGHDDCPW